MYVYSVDSADPVKKLLLLPVEPVHITL